MKFSVCYLVCLVGTLASFSQGNVGIGTDNPKTLLHVAANKTVLFGADTMGAGTKMMWIPAKHAFRAGVVGPVNNIPGLDGSIWDYDSIGLYSFASGLQNLAKGVGSIAMGRENNNAGSYSVAMGYGNRNLGVYSFVGGYKNINEANGSTIFGEYNTTTGIGGVILGTNNLLANNNTAIIGHQNTVSGVYSFVAGLNNTVTGSHSIILGDHSEAIGFESFTMGYYNKLKGNQSVAVGLRNTVNADYSMALGNGNIVNAFQSTVLGNYADSVIGVNPINWVDTDPLLIVGNGASYSMRQNAMVITKNGFLGIGTNTPKAPLQVSSNSSLTTPNLLVSETANDFARISFKNTNPGNWDIAGYPQQLLDGNAKAQFNFYFSKLGADVLSLRGNGDAYLTGSLTQSSDARLKKNVVPMKNVLPKVLQLHGYTYHWIDTSRGTETQIGLLAQEVEKQFPEVVYANEQGIKSVAYTNIVAVLIEAIKELQQQVDELKQLKK